MKFFPPLKKAAFFALTIVCGSIALTINGGTYHIELSGTAQLATIHGATAGAFVAVEPDTGGDPGQKWEIEVVNTNVNIKNLGSGLYLSYSGALQPNAPVVGSLVPHAWVLLPSAIPEHFFVVESQSLQNAAPLAFDLLLLRIFPPRTALRPYQPLEQRQAWRFIPTQ